VGAFIPAQASFQPNRVSRSLTMVASERPRAGQAKRAPRRFRASRKAARAESRPARTSTFMDRLLGTHAGDPRLPLRGGVPLGERAVSLPSARATSPGTLRLVRARPRRSRPPPTTSSRSTLRAGGRSACGRKCRRTRPSPARCSTGSRATPTGGDGTARATASSPRPSSTFAYAMPITACSMVQNRDLRASAASLIDRGLRAA
jgi:hypothetical protein